MLFADIMWLTSIIFIRVVVSDNVYRDAVAMCGHHCVVEGCPLSLVTVFPEMLESSLVGGSWVVIMCLSITFFPIPPLLLFLFLHC